MRVVVELGLISYEKKNEEAFCALAWKDLQNMLVRGGNPKV